MTRRSNPLFFALGVSCVLGSVACSSSREEISASTSDALISCQERNPPPSTQPGDLWRSVSLPVTTSVQGVKSIREMLDDVPESEQGPMFDAFYLAKKAAQGDLVSLELVLRYVAPSIGASLTPRHFDPDGRFIGAEHVSYASGDMDRVSWLIRNIFTHVTRGVDATSADGWKSLVLPILDEAKPTTPAVVSLQKRLETMTTGFCAYGHNDDALALARESDFNTDNAISLVEIVAWLQQSSNVHIDLGTRDGADLSADGEIAPEAFGGLACLKQLFAGTDDAGLGQATTGVGVTVIPCDTIDLMGLQGHGVRYQGTSISTTMGGPPEYEIVWVAASVLSPALQQRICMRPDEELELYVPYRQSEITECGISNGVYRAAYYHLTGWTDNWSPN